ncbi:hypothetical protein AVEN_31787-1 [Araneus ventricosus]|uniref:Uncharacterized protein n=1 Tax=Araneus ventricosus TaxID=182803 RepID=A0A4Y2SLK7_ARAVE|nr:hypothetical protein AVEN_31787-1 [Araneus ventricosus]
MTSANSILLECINTFPKSPSEPLPPSYISEAKMKLLYALFMLLCLIASALAADCPPKDCPSWCAKKVNPDGCAVCVCEQN